MFHQNRTNTGAYLVITLIHPHIPHNSQVPPGFPSTHVHVPCQLHLLHRTYTRNLTSPNPWTSS